MPCFLHLVGLHACPGIDAVCDVSQTGRASVAALVLDEQTADPSSIVHVAKCFDAEHMRSSAVLCC